MKKGFMDQTERENLIEALRQEISTTAALIEEMAADPGCAKTDRLVEHLQSAARQAIILEYFERKYPGSPTPEVAAIYPPPVKVSREEEPVETGAKPSSLHEKIATFHEDKSLSSKLQQAPVHDLVRAIGINQRFTFIRELFRNDNKAFADAVKHLNHLPGYQDAETFILKTLVPEYEWDVESDPVAQEFLNLVKRRYQ